MTALPQVNGDCWNRIGVWGDRSCPELVPAVHCHNCPVFAAAGQRFLDAPPPPDYLANWAERLAAQAEHAAEDLQSVIIFRLGEEWLALDVHVIAEVTATQPVHRIPHRAGLLAGVVNIRGELHLCAHLGQLLGASRQESGVRSQGSGVRSQESRGRMLVVRRGQESWVLPVDEVDQVQRLARSGLTAGPATLTRASRHLTLGVWRVGERAIGLLDDTRLLQVLQERALA
jgi:chemotaxis-related protein WspD